MLTQFVVWYLVVLLIQAAALPLAARLFGALPERGYALARPLGILLTGVLFWLGYSVGLLRNEAGGAWLALLAFAALSAALGRREIAAWRRGEWRFDRWTVVFTELFFLVAFAVWAAVRAHDPAADHTEEPMDLMFMNSIWSSPTYPPQDAWLAGFPISYYYFGYWLLTMLGRLAGQPPEIAYTLGQATWWALLLTGSYAIVYNLLARLPHFPIPNTQSPLSASQSPISDLQSPALQDTSRAPVLGGLLAALWVGAAGNVQAIIEWLYAMGAPVERLGAWFAVPGFPENARVTHNWYIAMGTWWWWRTSRVIQDRDLLNRHVEVIDEFPAFSYVLGDNHPHVVAMPIVILAIGLALALWFRAPHAARAHRFAFLPWEPAETLVAAAVLGSLLFLNTWDFPPYWLLLVVVWFTLRRRDGASVGRALAHALGFGGVLLGGALLIYAPYLLTAQSQAQGIDPNLFHSTHLRQFLLMFGPALLALGALLWMGWGERRPSWPSLAAWLAATVGAPILFLAVSTAVAVSTGYGQERLAGVELPQGATAHLPFILDRWTSRPWTLLLTTALAGLALALWWARAQPETEARPPAGPATAFALMLAALGLLLVAAPEFLFLRDYFGTRMNTVFKFYYQGWLLFALSGAFAITRALQRALARQGRSRAPAAFALPALALVLAALVFLPAAAYSKTGGFGGAPTFDSTAYLQQFAPAELAAARWLRDNAAPGARIAEAKGDSYRAELNRMSTVSGRPTLLGWEFHQRQWRGDAYGEMAAGRPEALDQMYRSANGSDLLALLDAWQVEFVVVGPAERAEYGVTPRREEELRRALALVFEEGDVRIYRKP